MSSETPAPWGPTECTWWICLGLSAGEKPVMDGCVVEPGYGSRRDGFTATDVAVMFGSVRYKSLGQTYWFI